MKSRKRILIFSLIIILFANISVVAETDNGASSYPMLAPADTWYQGSVPRSSFTTITIQNSIDSETADAASERWAAAVDSNGEFTSDIMCYVNGTELIIAGNGSGGIFLNPNSICVFSDSSENKDYFSSVTEINGMSILDTSNVISMKCMFLNACSLETVDISGFDTSNVTDMSFMFASTVSAKEMSFTYLDVSNWNTSNVLDMNRMFQLCSSLEELNVSRWNTSKVISMSGMFQRCKSLHTLDVSNWDTSSVENLSFMFHCENMPLGTIDVSNWDVSKVLTFDHFIAHAKLTLLGVENWKNSVVVVMNAMFHMSQNTVLDVSGFDTSNVITFDQMFEGCNQLNKIIGLENFDTSKSVGFSEMFKGTSKLTELNLSSFDTRKAVNGVQISSNGKTSNTLYNMFYGAIRLRKITIGENFSFNGDGSNKIADNKGAFHTPSGTYISGADGYWYNESGEAFLPADIPDKTAGTYYAVYPGAQGVLASGRTWYKGKTPHSSITKINIVDSYEITGNETESWDASSLQDSSVMCYINGTELTITGNDGKVIAHKDSSYMFDGYSMLKSLDLSSFDTSSVTNMNGMFRNCTKLNTIYVSNLFNTNALSTSEKMFTGCTNLIGGNGTSYNSSYINSAYAVIDTDETPGYFTEKEMTFVNTVYSKENNTLQVSVSVSEKLKEKNGIVIIALYGNNGMINSCCTDTEEPITHTFVNLPIVDGKFTVKVFYWTGIKDIVPICIPITKTIQK